MRDAKIEFETSATGIFSLLEGEWQQERTITSGGHYTGKANFTRLDEITLIYREEGTLTLEGGYTNTVHRDYIFKREDDRIGVYFAEKPPRLFHHLTFDSQALAKAEHLCSPDTYQSAYRIINPDSFTISHDVTGPRKNYTMVTHYAR